MSIHFFVFYELFLQTPLKNGEFCGIILYNIEILIKRSDIMSYLLSVGQRIRTYRKKMHKSMDTVAKECNYQTRSSISKIEKGQSDIPLSRLLDLADALGVSPLELLLPVDPDAYTETETLLLEFYKHSPDVRAFVDGIFEVSKGDAFSAAYIAALKASASEDAIIEALASAPESDETLMRDED